MAKGKPAAYDVWFVAADTVYKGVPSGVLLGWAEQGRVAAADKFRPAGSAQAWGRVGADPFFASFLYRRGAAESPTASAASLEELQPVELDVRTRRGEEEDDDPDMIPLIDISLVLLIFFMMTSVVSTLSPVDVPDMRYASEPSKEQDAITLIIDKRGDAPPYEVFYAVRVGEQPVQAEDNNLPTPEDAIRRLDAKLAAAQRPPEVRIACHKRLPGDRVDDLTPELDKRQRDNKIAYYGAEVNNRE